MNPQSRPFTYQAVPPLPAAPAATEPIAQAAAIIPVTDQPPVGSDLLWNKWAEKGRREDAAFKEKTRVIAIGLTIVAVAVGLATWVINVL